MTGWVLGTAWIPMEGEEHLTLYSSWHLENLQLNNFVERCRQQRFHRDVGIAGRVWHRARAEWTRNLAAEPADSFPLSPAAAAADLRAAFAAPVIRDAMVEAVLFFHAHELKEADERLIAVISRVATQLGFALRHKQLEERLTKQYAVVTHMRDSLEEELSRRTGELTQTNELLEAEIATREQIQGELEAHLLHQQAIAELSRQALAGTELSLLMQAVAALAAKTLNVEFCKILELLPDSKNLLLRAGVGWAPGSVGRATVSADKDSQAGYTLLSRESVIVVDLASEKRFNGPPLLRDHSVISGMSVIIGPADRPFGVLGAHTASPRSFSQDDIDFLQSAANVLFQVIERNRALLEVSRHATWLKRPFVTTKKDGTGIGLVVVRQIVIAHNGTISYRSKVGEGTTFRLELPHN